MSVALEGPLRIARVVALAAICRRQIGVRRIGSGVAGIVAKRPIALLIARAGKVEAFLPDGRSMPLERAEALLPGVTEWLLGLGE